MFATLRYGFLITLLLSACEVGDPDVFEEDDSLPPAEMPPGEGVIDDGLDLEPDPDFLADELEADDDFDDELDVEIGSLVLVHGPRVLPRVQRFANRVCARIGACRVSTYRGHPPGTRRALDFLVSRRWGSFPRSYRRGNRVARFALRQARRYRVSYIIWRQRINYADGRGWFRLANRGSVTENHYDHVHVGFKR